MFYKWKKDKIGVTNLGLFILDPCRHNISVYKSIKTTLRP